VASTEDGAGATNDRLRAVPLREWCSGSGAQGVVLTVSYTTVETWPVLCEVTARPRSNRPLGPGSDTDDPGDAKIVLVSGSMVGMVQTPPPTSPFGTKL
jgi:hypothetical protein